MLAATLRGEWKLDRGPNGKLGDSRHHLTYGMLVNFNFLLIPTHRAVGLTFFSSWQTHPLAGVTTPWTAGERDKDAERGPKPRSSACACWLSQHPSLSPARCLHDSRYPWRPASPCTLSLANRASSSRGARGGRRASVQSAGGRCVCFVESGLESWLNLLVLD